MRFVAFYFLVLLLLFHPLAANAWPGRVVAVTDGDTLTVEPTGGGKSVKIRLHGIDTPERRQPLGDSAHQLMIAIALFQPVYIDEVSKDRYGRTVAVIVLKNGERLQDALLKEGLAWVCPRYCRDCHEWEQLQNDAQMARRGIWANDDSVPPWEWRRGVRASKLQ